MPPMVLINGNFRLASEVAISHLDQAYMLGLGVFETLLWDGEQCLELDQHIERLSNAVGKLLETQWSSDGVGESIAKLVEKNEILELGRVRITASSVKGELQTVITAEKYQQRTGEVRLRSSPYKVNPDDATTGYKTTSYANYSHSLKHAHSQGGDESLLLNTSDVLCECATSNIFFVKDERLYTPSLETGCLPGIMRAEVLKIANDRGVKVEQGFYTLPDIQQADSVFITNSLRRIQLVSELDSQEFDSSSCVIVASLLS